jgi:hypothetical protein
MTLDYSKVWNCLNELESVTSKICSAREILECAIDAHEKHKRDKTEALMYATDEYLQYYLKDFDEKFKSAWNEIVVKFRQDESTSDDYIFDIIKKEKMIKKWVLPVEVDGSSGEYFLQLPDDLLDQVNWKENDSLSWENNKDGTFTIRKVTKPLGMDEC